MFMKRNLPLQYCYGIKDQLKSLKHLALVNFLKIEEKLTQKSVKNFKKIDRPQRLAKKLTDPKGHSKIFGEKVSPQRFVQKIDRPQRRRSKNLTKKVGQKD